LKWKIGKSGDKPAFPTPRLFMGSVDQPGKIFNEESELNFDQLGVRKAGLPLLFGEIQERKEI
jgi:hypothetical protein